MDGERGDEVDGELVSLARKSWVSYIGIAFFSAGMFGIIAPLAWGMSWVAGLTVAIGAMAYLCYVVLLLGSVHLYYDDSGVWVYSGIFPWSRGTVGVKWRDLDEATFTTGLIPWLTKSTRVSIRHRFTKGTEIRMIHAAHGGKAAIRINARHQTLIESGLLK